MIREIVPVSSKGCRMKALDINCIGMVDCCICQAGCSNNFIGKFLDKEQDVIYS